MPYNKFATHCTRCGGEPADDSSLCPAHRDDERARKRLWMAKVRKQRQRHRRCRYCGGPRRLREKSCLACRVRRNRLSALRVRVRQGHDRAEQIAAATRQDADGRTRYHGQGRRGNQTHAALNRQDVGHAERAFVAFKVGVALLDTDEVRLLPLVQRDDLKSAAAHQGQRVGRHIADVLVRLGHARPGPARGHGGHEDDSEDDGE